MKSILKTIICGYEKSGTTLTGTVIGNHPTMTGGFEGGLLLGRCPREFLSIKPYCDYFLDGWGVDRRELEWILDTDCFEESYRRIRTVARAVRNKNALLFDKTPVYMKHLADVLARAPATPCIVMVRDPRPVFCSWARWSAAGEDLQRHVTERLEAFANRYLGYADGYEKARAMFPDRILLIRFEEMLTRPRETFRRIFAFLDLAFDPDYFQFPAGRYLPLYGDRLDPSLLNKYRNVLNPATGERILDLTRRCRNWWWEYD